MIVLKVGLQEIQSKELDWDEDVCSDLVNQVGQKIEQIGRLDDSQKTDALIRVQRGGSVRWHILSTEQQIISSTYWESYWGNCTDVFSISVGLERDSGVMPIALENTQLCNLVRDLGSDLEQLQKLKRSQVVDICYGLKDVGFVKCFVVQEATQDNPSVSSSKALPSHRFYYHFCIDVIQPTSFPSLAPYLSMSDLELFGPSNKISPVCVEPNLRMNDMYKYSHYPGDEVDRLWDVGQTPDESVPFITPETILHGTVYPLPGVASPAETISTPGPDGGASSYSTASTMYFDTSQIGEYLTLPGLRATMLNQAVKAKRLVSNQLRYSQITPVATSSNQKIIHLLQSCVFGQVDVLEQKRIQKVLEAEVRLLIKNPCRMLQPLLGSWDKNTLLDLHPLGLPVLWKGIQGAVNYLRILDVDDTNRFLDPVAKRIGQVLLYINYEELCKRPKEYCPPSTSKPTVTHVLNCILDAYTDDPRISMSPQSRRNKISGYHVRRGRWWWRLAGTLGVGMLLIADSSLMSIMCNNSFTINQINVLATFALNTRPGTIRIFRALELMVKPLMFGRITDDLRQAILDDELGLLGRHELARVHDEDETAVACQRIENPWTAVDAESYAREEMTEFLASMPAI
ncbi:serine-proline rich protein [Aspergillus ruber CBS 135680]|uniref:Serine-proline rich protein n=1 Tax=Aspergillus ruber (strain CBS 135680) TaxID=1388766 RepID=A0A017SMY3_ASPRC|nr:serine-proline rich protein [Aspergillus ruber CBS 135680]EYE98322.1 serine-proline rich protein [Aspergillus ruber CBS 135680]